MGSGFMIEEVAVAIDQKDYERATQLLERLSAGDPQVMLQAARLQEGQADWDKAEQTYKQVLRHNAGMKLTLAARQGLERIDAAQKQLRQQQHQQAKEEIKAELSRAPNFEGLSTGGGISALVLEPVEAEQKTSLAQEFAKIMSLEAYAARLLLPSRGWRLYRSGQFAELQAYAKQLQAVGVPLFCYPIEKLKSIKVLEVSYFQSAEDKVTVFCTSGDIHAEPQAFVFTWSEVKQRVEGLIPIFEQVVDRDRKGKMLRKEQVQDHIQFCDLHLPGRQTILRVYSGAYQFNKGISLATVASAHAANTNAAGKVAAGRVQSRLTNGTTWANWQYMQTFLDQHLVEVRRSNDFSTFAETALDHPDLLSSINAHIHLFRREEESLWDQAFHLYSCIAFWRYL
jgi:hypothetical protein